MSTVRWEEKKAMTSQTFDLRDALARRLPDLLKRHRDTSPAGHDCIYRFMNTQSNVFTDYAHRVSYVSDLPGRYMHATPGPLVRGSDGAVQVTLRGKVLDCAWEALPKCHGEHETDLDDDYGRGTHDSVLLFSVLPSDQLECSICQEEVDMDPREADRDDVDLNDTSTAAPLRTAASASASDPEPSGTDSETDEDGWNKVNLAGEDNGVQTRRLKAAPKTPPTTIVKAVHRECLLEREDLRRVYCSVEHLFEMWLAGKDNVYVKHDCLARWLQMEEPEPKVLSHMLKTMVGRAASIKHPDQQAHIMDLLCMGTKYDEAEEDRKAVAWPWHEVAQEVFDHYKLGRDRDAARVRRADEPIKRTFADRLYERLEGFLPLHIQREHECARIKAALVDILQRLPEITDKYSCCIETAKQRAAQLNKLTWEEKHDLVLDELKTEVGPVSDDVWPILLAYLDHGAVSWSAFDRTPKALVHLEALKQALWTDQRRLALEPPPMCPVCEDPPVFGTLRLPPKQVDLGRKTPLIQSEVCGHWACEACWTRSPRCRQPLTLRVSDAISVAHPASQSPSAPTPLCGFIAYNTMTSKQNVMILRCQQWMAKLFSRRPVAKLRNDDWPTRPQRARSCCECGSAAVLASFEHGRPEAKAAAADAAGAAGSSSSGEVPASGLERSIAEATAAGSAEAEASTKPEMVDVVEVAICAGGHLTCASCGSAWHPAYIDCVISIGQQLSNDSWIAEPLPLPKMHSVSPEQCQRQKEPLAEFCSRVYADAHWGPMCNEPFTGPHRAHLDATKNVWWFFISATSDAEVTGWMKQHMQKAADNPFIRMPLKTFLDSVLALRAELNTKHWDVEHSLARARPWLQAYQAEDWEIVRRIRPCPVCWHAGLQDDGLCNRVTCPACSTVYCRECFSLDDHGREHGGLYKRVNTIFECLDWPLWRQCNAPESSGVAFLDLLVNQYAAVLPQAQEHTGQWRVLAFMFELQRLQARAELRQGRATTVHADMLQPLHRVLDLQRELNDGRLGLSNGDYLWHTLKRIRTRKSVVVDATLQSSASALMDLVVKQKQPISSPPSLYTDASMAGTRSYTFEFLRTRADTAAATATAGTSTDRGTPESLFSVRLADVLFFDAVGNPLTPVNPHPWSSSEVRVKVQDIRFLSPTDAHNTHASRWAFAFTHPVASYTFRTSSFTTLRGATPLRGES